MVDLDKIFNFIKLLDDFKNIERVIYVRDDEPDENDAEHSFQLAMFAWYLTDVYESDLDKGKVLKYALAHDLVEIYAGDTFAYDVKTKSDEEEKRTREAAAARKLQENLSEFKELHAHIEEYEDKSNREARFVYALDKLIATINIYLDDGYLWKKKGISLDLLKKKKGIQIMESPEAGKYFKELLSVLEEKETSLFDKT